LPEYAFLRKAVLLLTAGLLIQIPISIFAQDSAQADPYALEQSLVIEDPLREAELALTFDESSAGGTTGAGPTIWDFVRMVLVLALAAAAIYGIVFFLKRSSKKTAVSDPFLKILANAHLGSNRYVHVVSVGNKTWLLGSSDGGVNLIGEVDDKDVINAMLLEDSKKIASEPGRLPDFLSILRRFGTPAGSSSVNTRNTANTDEIRKRRERLGGL